MLNPDTVVDAFVSALRDIPEVVEQLEGDPTLIFAHHYLYGEEFSLLMAIAKMPSPSVMVAYEGYVGGNFDGSSKWKHRFTVYIRPKNAATGHVGGPSSPSNPARPCSPMNLWWLMMNRPVTSTGQNIRMASILEPNLYPMDTPSLIRQVDENQADFFISTCVFAEAGDD